MCFGVFPSEGQTVGPFSQITSIFHSLGLPWRSLCFPGGLDSKESTCNAADLDSILGLGRSPGEGNGNPLQYSCLENSMGRVGYRS